MSLSFLYTAIMAYQEGYNTVQPLLFDRSDFDYRKKHMEYYLKIEIEMWFIVKRGFTLLVDELGEPLELEKWTSDIK